MKRFVMITEADARVLDYGSTVTLAAGGHVTPLAQDTLTARRIAVVREGGDVDAAALAPRADVRTVALASDHTGVGLKAAIRTHLRARGLAAIGDGARAPLGLASIAGLACLGAWQLAGSLFLHGLSCMQLDRDEVSGGH